MASNINTPRMDQPEPGDPTSAAALAKAGVATPEQNQGLQHSDTTSPETTRDDTTDAGVPMLPGSGAEPQGPEDALGPGPKRGDYTSRLGGAAYNPHVSVYDPKQGRVVLVPQTGFAAQIGDVPGAKGGVETAPERPAPVRPFTPDFGGAAPGNASPAQEFRMREMGLRPDGTPMAQVDRGVVTAAGTVDVSRIEDAARAVTTSDTAKPEQTQGGEQTQTQALDQPQDAGSATSPGDPDQPQPQTQGGEQTQTEDAATLSAGGASSDTVPPETTSVDTPAPGTSTEGPLAGRPRRGGAATS